MNSSDCKNLLWAKYDVAVCQHSDDELAEIFKVVTDENARDYLRRCLPDNVYFASTIRIQPLKKIKQWLADHAGFYRKMFQYGCLVFATSTSGRMAAVQGSSGKVYWIYPDAYHENKIYYQHPQTQKWEGVDYSPENVILPMTPLADNIWEFMDGVLTERLLKTLRDLN